MKAITNTFFKTVSAFSNYDGGVILFGIDDNGKVKGITDVKQACLDIEKTELTTAFHRNRIIHLKYRVIIR